MTLNGETIFESGPGLRNWITPESVDGFGMAVAARVGSNFRMGRGINVSVGFDSGIDSAVGLASGDVGEANSEVGELVVRAGSTDAVGMAVFGKRARVGICIDGAGLQAVKKEIRLSARMKRWNIIRL